MKSREEIALQLLCAMLTATAGVAIAGENDVRFAFRLAQIFEKVSDEEGGRPVRSKARSGRGWEADDDDE